MFYRCYDGVSATFGKQWIFRAVELPPIAQPFEIVFKTFYNPPTDVIALDNIVFESTLCGEYSTLFSFRFFQFVCYLFRV